MASEKPGPSARISTRIRSCCRAFRRRNQAPPQALSRDLTEEQSLAGTMSEKPSPSAGIVTCRSAATPTANLRVGETKPLRRHCHKEVDKEKRETAVASEKPSPSAGIVT